MTTKIIFIAGATASGKSGLALRLAKLLGGTIINADSMQVFDTIQLLSARPTIAEMDGIPHSLYGFLSPAEQYSVAHWHDDAMLEVAKARSQASIPILVGGTGLYFKALLDGLSEVPNIDPDIRENIRSLLQTKGAEYIYKLLEGEDPDMAANLDMGDGQRVARALEVIRSTGVSLQAWQDKPTVGGLSADDASGDILKLVVERPRDETYERINTRLVEMINQGALDEVAKLKEMKLPTGSLALKALGVSSFMDYLDDIKTKDEVLEEAQTLTRRYAKRQMTWLRNQFGGWTRVSPDILKTVPDKELLGFLQK